MNILLDLRRFSPLLYGREGTSKETREALLQGQMLEGLKRLLRAPAVSGALTYSGLCLVAKAEERRLTALKKRQEYKDPMSVEIAPRREWMPPAQGRSRHYVERPSCNRGTGGSSAGRCYTCGQFGHKAWNCRSRKTESSGLPSQPVRTNEPKTRQVHTDSTSTSQQHDSNSDDPLSFLFLHDSEDNGDVSVVRINDQG